MPNAEYKNLHGTTLSFPARATLLLTLISADLPEISTKEIPDTDLGSTVDKSIASALQEAGEFSAVVRYVPGLTIPVGAADETVRITFPMLTGQTVAGKYEFTGHITKMGLPKATADGRAEVTITIKCNSIPTWTEGTP
jgi:hypothetical protein